ncbi:MAG TPA: hypothetical protein VGR62_15720 [Candidatus Binatia bacterium]|jgi:CheY-like chemotaxis protein|nr:hypothetical protein [Candidatus Binatia bacterium]
MSILVIETASPPTLVDRLRARGCSVLGATDDVAALAILEARHDVAMVITDATAVIARIRAHPELGTMPIVACTDDTPLDVQHVLPRAVDTETLLAVVATLLAEEVPVLEPPVEVQTRLAIDERSYRRLAANVAALIARTTDTLPPAATVPDQETLAAIAEAGLLIGARRITTALARLRASDVETQADAVRGLQRELRRVYGALRAAPGAALTATG